MKFRDYEVDEVKIVTGATTTELERNIKALDKEYVFMDLQYGSFYVQTQGPTFSALALLQRRKK